MTSETPMTALKPVALCLFAVVVFAMAMLLMLPVFL